MIIQVKGDNLEITEEHDKLVYNKLEQKLEKYLKPFAADEKIADVRIKKRTRWGYKVNFSMRLPGKKQIYAEETDRNLKTALNQLNDQIIRQLKEYRGKLGIDDKTKPDIKGALASEIQQE